MARSYARIGTAIWDDPEFLDLPPLAQRAYLFLLGQKDLPLTGVLVRRSKWDRSSADRGSALDIDGDLAVLEERGFVVCDDDTDEVWIRTFMRHDGVLRNGKLRKGARARVGAIHSDRLRALVVAQLDDADAVPDDPSAPATPVDEEPPSGGSPSPAVRDDSSHDLSDGSCDDLPDAPKSSHPSSTHPETSIPSSQSDPLALAAWKVIAARRGLANGGRHPSYVERILENLPTEVHHVGTNGAVTVAEQTRWLLDTYEIHDAGLLADVLDGSHRPNTLNLRSAAS